MVVGEHLHPLVERVGEELLEDLGHPRAEGGAASLRQGAASRLLKQSVAEAVLELRVAAHLTDDSRPEQSRQAGLEPLAAGDSFKHPRRELAADDGGGLAEHARLRIEPVHAGDQQGVKRRREPRGHAHRDRPGTRADLVGLECVCHLLEVERISLGARDELLARARVEEPRCGDVEQLPGRLVRDRIECELLEPVGEAASSRGRGSATPACRAPAASS